jgi:phosphate starvation-inducible PhoH-like protein
LAEASIQLQAVSPQQLFGVNNRYLNLIKSFFPKLKVTARGDVLKVHGEEADLLLFQSKLAAILEHVERYNAINEEVIERIIMEDRQALMAPEDDKILLYGTQGQAIRAKTTNQIKMVKAVRECDMVFAIGPAGTGKTYTGVALAVRALKNREVKRIILTRPAVEAGENLGFLPGDLKDKLDPYLQPLYDALRDMIPAEKLAKYLEDHVIQIAPLAFMRGRTLDHAFVILDEAQNTTPAQMKMFLTRMGQAAKFIITGDTTQVDLPPRTKSGLIESLRIVGKIQGIGVVTLDNRDVIRHPLVKDIIEAYEQHENPVA